MVGKECPMCTETMRVHERDTVVRTPGTAETKTVPAREWVCPECDYYEDVEEGEGASSERMW